MIYVRVELWPHGDKSRAKRLGEIKISNTGLGSKTSGDYLVRLFGKRSGVTPWKTGSVSKFPRTRLNAFDLIYRALRNILSERNPT